MAQTLKEIIQDLNLEEKVDYLYLELELNHLPLILIIITEERMKQGDRLVMIIINNFKILKILK